MQKFRTMQLCAAAFILAASASACATATAFAPPEPVESFVDTRLREAGEAITKDLAILTGSTQNRDKNALGGASDLYAKMSLSWTGPIEGALTQIAARIGFRFTRSGTAPVTPVTVHVKVIERPALDVLREIGLQTGKGEGLEVDEAARVIHLHYGEGVSQ